MKRNGLALLMAVTLAVTSLDSTAIFVSGAEFSAETESMMSEEVASEEPETITAENEETEENQEETNEVEFSDEAENPTDSNEEKNVELDADEVNTFNENNEQEETVLFSSDANCSSEVMEAERSSAMGREDADVLEPGNDYTVSVTEEDDEIWFSYTPEETGDYTIWSEGGNDIDPSVTLYLQDEDAETLSMIGFNYDADDKSCDFCLKENLKKDRKYYYRIEAWGYDEVPFTIHFIKTPEVQSVSVDITNAKKQFDAELDECYVKGTKLSITYADGNFDEIIFGEKRLYDKYGIEYDYIYEKTGDTGGRYYPGDALPTGTYYVRFRCNGEEISNQDTYLIEVKKTEEILTTLKVGMNEDIENPDNAWKWYTFTPEASGRYCFIGFSHMRIVYQDEEESVYAYNYNGPSSSIYMNEQTEYRLGFKKNTDTETNLADTIALTIKNTTVREISCSPETIVLNRALEYADQYSIIPECSLMWTYVDGTQSKTEEVKFGYEFEDAYGNRFSPELVNTATNEIFEYSYDSTELPDGTYKLSFACGGVVSNEVLLTVVPINTTTLSSISTGTNTVKVGGYDWVADRVYNLKWYTFTPTENGSYYFDAKNVNYHNVLAESKEVNEQGEIKDILPEENIYTLEAGKTYIFGWYINSDQYNNETVVDVNLIPEVQSVSLKSYEPKDMSFIESMETVRLNSCEVEVTYKDGQKETYSLNGTDMYGRELTWAIYDSNGELCDYDRNKIPAGDYKIKVSFGGVEADNSIDVKVIPLSELEATDLSSGSAELGENDEKILKYKPSADGYYEFEFNTYLLSPLFSIAASDGKEIDDVQKTGYGMTASLKQDTVYYIKINSKKALKVTVSYYDYALPTKLKAVLKRKTAYIPGVDCVHDKDLQTEITYGDGSVRILNGTGDVDGYRLRYKIEERNSGIGSEPIETGNWHIVPYLYDDDGDMDDDEVDLKIETEAAELNVVMPEENQFQNIKEDEWAYAGGEGGYYIFTAEKDGIFGFVGSEGQKFDCRFGGFYTKKSNGYKENPSYDDGSSKLQKGKEYLVFVGSGNSGKFKITKYEKPDEIDKIKPISEITLQAGREETVRIQDDNRYLTCKYTPGEDGYYELQSEIWNNYNDYHMFVELYDDGEYITNNGSCLRIIAKLSAGKTYTYELIQDSNTYYNEPFVLKFNKISGNAIKNADLVLKDGKQATDFRIDDAILDTYDLKIDYENGCSRVFSSCSVTDEFGNYIGGPECDFSGNLAQDEIDCKVNISYKNLDETNEKTISKIVKAKAVGSFEEIQLGKEYAIDGTECYKFIPEEDGYYIYSRTGAKTDNWEYTWFRTTDNMYSFIYGTKVGKNTYSAFLQAGKMYYLRVTDAVKEKLKVVKAKSLKGLETANAPTQKCLRDGVDSIAYGSLKIKAFYTDGSTEEIAYGERDSSGREVYVYKEWLKNGKCRVYVKLGEYRTSFDVEAASEDEIQMITVDKTNEIKAAANDEITLKFIPDRTAFYKIHITNGIGVNVDYNTYQDNFADLAYYSPCRLKSGETYYIHITAEADNPTVSVVPMEMCESHTFGDWKITKTATCTATGIEMRECTVCGEQETRTTPVLNHSYKWITDKAATCTQEGSRHEECTDCKIIGKTERVKATGSHTMGSWKVIKEATALSTGVQERICSICGGAKETKSIAKLAATVTLNTGINTTTPLKVKQTLQVKTTGLAKGDKVASWKSSNTKIVTVSGNGKLTAKKSGTATITVKLQSGLSKSFKVKVQSSEVKTTKISGLKSKVTVQKGKKLTLKPVISPITSKEKVTYSSSDKKIATVSSKGVITAKKAGTAKITVKSGSKKFTVKVTVPKTKTTALKASASVTVKKGKTVNLKVTKTPSNSDESITYVSSDKKIATVDKKGKIKGVKKGTATITVKSGNITKKIKVTVK